jgi:hypothetical protein
MTWTELCEANVDHFNDNPVAHTVLTVAYGVVAVVAYRKLIKCLTKDEQNR